MKSIFAVSILVFIMSGSAMSQNTAQQEHKAQWWNDSSETFKIGVVSGYLMASARAADAIAFSCLASKHGGQVPEQLPPEQEMKDCGENNHLYQTVNCGAFRMGQVKDGLDVFYKDWKNQQVEFEGAIRYVCDQLLGKTDSYLANELRRIRGQN